MDSLKLAKRISELAADIKAIDIKILDLRDLSSFTDFFVVCSGTSDRQIRAIADKVVLDLKKENVRPVSKEGYEQGEWVLVDYADVVLHVFGEQARANYDLEGFWSRAPHLEEKAKKVKKAGIKRRTTKSKRKAPPKKKSIKSKTSKPKKKKK